MFEEHQSIVRNLIDAVYNEKRYDAASELLTEDVKFYFQDETGRTSYTVGRQYVIDHVHQLHHAFPDWRSEILDLFGEGDRFAVRVISSGRHTNTFRGFPPTGREFEVRSISTGRFRDGEIAELREFDDQLGLYQQLELIHPGSILPRAVAERISEETEGGVSGALRGIANYFDKNRKKDA